MKHLKELLYRVFEDPFDFFIRVVVISIAVSLFRESFSQ